jgi:hypothetical protein
MPRRKVGLVNLTRGCAARILHWQGERRGIATPHIRRQSRDESPSQESENLAFKSPRFLRAVKFTALTLQPASVLVAESQHLS